MQKINFSLLALKKIINGQKQISVDIGESELTRQGAKISIIFSGKRKQKFAKILVFSKDRRTKSINGQKPKKQN